MGSEEPSPDFSGRARRSQNQFTPLGDGVNKLIFKRFPINLGGSFPPIVVKGISGINPIQKRVINAADYGINNQDIWQMASTMGGWHSSLYF
jgi:hypothetical protein